MHILIVEDEPLIARFLARGLQAEGYSTRRSPATARRRSSGSRAREWDLVMLDLLLPGLDGFDVLAGAADATAACPVLVLSARQAVETKVAALDGGASDFLAKPFSFDELLARVRAQPARGGRAPARREPAARPSLQLDARDARSCAVATAAACTLSAREYAAARRTCCGRPDEVVSRERILNAVWEYQFDPRSNVVDVYVGRLRRKLAARSRDRRPSAAAATGRAR